MIRLRLAIPCAMTAIAATLAGASPTSAQSRYQQTPYQQPPTAQYGQPSYQPPAYAPPVQPQTIPYQTGGLPTGTFQVAKQESLVQPSPQAAATGYGSYQLPNYQAPAPGARYAMLHDDAVDDTQAESVPLPPQSVPAPTNADNSQGNWEGYVQAPSAGDATYGCETGACNTGYNNDCDYGAFGGGSQVLGRRLLGGGNNCRQWFFGVYGLYMTRDNPSYERYAVLADPEPPTYPYYPTQSQTTLSSNDVEPDWQWGAEIRLGATFGTPCGCETSRLRPYAWEVVYWGLADDGNQAVVTDIWSDTDRMYSTENYDGLEYDRDGTAGGTYAARDMPEYWDDIYDPNFPTNDIRLLGLRVRNNFSAQNLELNFIRFPLAACNSCDPCGPPRFTVNGVCGFRFMRLDEDWQLAAMYTQVDGGGTPLAGEPTIYPGGFPTNDPHSLFHDINVDNELAGFQFGSNMNWLIGCKWSAFCDTQVGIYGNRITSNQRVWGGGGGEVYWDGTTNAVNVNSRKTDVSFLGELRAGFGYQVGCNCRLTTAYRVIAITGVALAGEQIPSNWSSSDYVGIIDSNDSLVLHGLQTGVEWKY